MDFLVSKFPTLTKLETIGDAFVVVGIAENYSENFQATVFTEMMEFTLLVREIVKLVPLDEDNFVRLRIGLHCGEVVGGLTGYLNPRFCLFGDTINTTARMESNGQVDKIHCSSDFADNLRKYSSYNINIIRRNIINVKGKGEMQTYWIEAINISLLKEKFKDEIDLVLNILSEEDGICRPLIGSHRNISKLRLSPSTSTSE